MKDKLAAIGMGLLFALLPGLAVGAVVALLFEPVLGLWAGGALALFGLDMCFRGTESVTETGCGLKKRPFTHLFLLHPKKKPDL